MKPTQRIMAQVLGLSEGHLSDIINGKTEIGKYAAKKISGQTGRAWNEIIVMGADEVRELLDLQRDEVA